MALIFGGLSFIVFPSIYKVISQNMKKRFNRRNFELEELKIRMKIMEKESVKFCHEIKKSDIENYYKGAIKDKDHFVCATQCWATSTVIWDKIISDFYNTTSTISTNSEWNDFCISIESKILVRIYINSFYRMDPLTGKVEYFPGHDCIIWKHGNSFILIQSYVQQYTIEDGEKSIRILTREDAINIVTYIVKIMTEFVSFDHTFKEFMNSLCGHNNIPSSWLSDKAKQKVTARIEHSKIDDI